MIIIQSPGLVLTSPLANALLLGPSAALEMVRRDGVMLTAEEIGQVEAVASALLNGVAGDSFSLQTPDGVRHLAAEVARMAQTDYDRRLTLFAGECPGIQSPWPAQATPPALADPIEVMATHLDLQNLREAFEELSLLAWVSSLEKSPFAIVRENLEQFLDRRGGHPRYAALIAFVSEQMDVHLQKFSLTATAEEIRADRALRFNLEFRALSVLYHFLKLSDKQQIELLGDSSVVERMRRLEADLQGSFDAKTATPQHWKTVFAPALDHWRVEGETVQLPLFAFHRKQQEVELRVETAPEELLLSDLPLSARALVRFGLRKVLEEGGDAFRQEQAWMGEVLAAIRQDGQQYRRFLFSLNLAPGQREYLPRSHPLHRLYHHLDEMLEVYYRIAAKLENLPPGFREQIELEGLQPFSRRLTGLIVRVRGLASEDLTGIREMTELLEAIRRHFHLKTSGNGTPELFCSASIVAICKEESLEGGALIKALRQAPAVPDFFKSAKAQYGAEARAKRRARLEGARRAKAEENRLVREDRLARMREGEAQREREAAALRAAQEAERAAHLAAEKERLAAEQRDWEKMQAEEGEEKGRRQRRSVFTNQMSEAERLLRRMEDKILELVGEGVLAEAALDAEVFYVQEHREEHPSVFRRRMEELQKAFDTDASRGILSQLYGLVDEIRAAKGRLASHSKPRNLW